jgi:hypothetical protein
LERPAMTSVRGQLGDRLRRQLAHAYQQRRHPSRSLMSYWVEGGEA